MDVGQALVTLSAVVIGGGVSAAGSIWVNRRELTRQQRIKLHLEVLPALEGLVRALFEQRGPDLRKTQPLVELAAQLERLALVAGRAEHAHASQIHEWALQADSLQPFRQEWSGVYEGAAHAMASQAMEPLFKAILSEAQLLRSVLATKLA